MKKIIHLVSNKVWGGGEQYVYGVCGHLIKNGTAAEVVCRNIPVITRRFENLGLPVHTMALKGAIDMASAWQLAKMIKCQDFVIHVHNFKDAFTAVYAKLLSGNGGTRVIVTRHLVRKGKSSVLYNWLYRHIDLIIFVSDLAKEAFLSGKPKTGKTVTIHNSIDTAAAATEREDIRAFCNIGDDCTVGMYHGRLCHEKGLDMLIKAIAQVKCSRLHWLMAGTGDEDYVSHLKNEAQKAGISGRIHYIGFKPNVLDYISQCDFGVLPTVVPESFSLACLEYMSQGKCVIATNNGGQREYINDNENGFLVPPGDVEALAKKISLMASDSALRQRIGENARRKYEDSMSYGIFLNKIINAYGL